MNQPVLFQAKLRTPCAVLGIHCTDEQLSGITFLDQSSEELLPEEHFAREVCAQLQAYMADANFRFALPMKLDGTEHQRKVWQLMRIIPRGQTLSYGEIAAEIASSPRAVGQACGSNPIPIVIPCHRVVSKAGLGGFMHRGDDRALAIKRYLLAHEANAATAQLK